MKHVLKNPANLLIMSIMVLTMAFTFSCSVDDGDGKKGESAYYGWYGSGSAKNYTISTAAQLIGLSHIVKGVYGDSIPPQDDFRGKTITLTADINMNGKSWYGIASSYGFENGFNGTFDGNNKTISGLQTNNQGFFGKIGEHGTVKNILLTNFSLDGGDGSGGLARTNEGTVQNVGINGSLNEGNTGAGGLVGWNRGIIENSYFSGSISGAGGGIASSNIGTIRSCYSTGSVGGIYSDGGGIVGTNSGTIQNCYSTSNITGYYRAGGIAESNNGTIQNCYTTGSVIGSADYYIRGVGGIAGRQDNGTIRNSVALNQSITGEVNLGRISRDYSSNTNNYGLSEMVMESGYTIVSEANGKDGADVTFSELDESWWQNTVEFSSSVWEFRDGKLPILKNMPNGTQNP
jgi:hypothetical protein